MGVHFACGLLYCAQYMHGSLMIYCLPVTCPSAQWICDTFVLFRTGKQVRDLATAYTCCCLRNGDLEAVQLETPPLAEEKSTPQPLRRKSELDLQTVT
jgi:hypothetical protein